MDRARLSQYRDIKREIALLNREIRSIGKMPTSDVVRGSMTHHPYVLHDIRVEGAPSTQHRDKLLKLLLDQKKRLEAERLAIEEYIDGIKDSQVRQIVRLKYVRGYSWQDIAQQVGGNNTPAGMKMRFKRYIEQAQA